jgi:uncharacterized membrane protein
MIIETLRTHAGKGGCTSSWIMKLYFPARFALIMCHIAGFGILYGGAIFRNWVPSGYFWLTIISGLLLVMLESLARGLQRLVTLKSFLALMKLLAIAVLQFIPDRRVIILSIVMILGVFSAHLPQKIRGIRIDRLLENSVFINRFRWKRFLKKDAHRT